MKLNITSKHIVAILMLGALTSCDDFFDAPSKSSLDESVIFSTPGLAISAVDGIKIPMGETNSYRGRFLPWYGMNTDVEWYNSSQTVGDNSDLAVYNAKPINSQMNTENNAWAMMYSGIERANLCIRGLRNYGSPRPNNQMGALLAEALTLRAVYYADLMKAWGDVPARFEPINSETLFLAKTDRDVIYKQLLDDLAEAATLAPWPNETPFTSTVERVNKAFVKGLRARIALVAAGFSQRPGNDIRRGEVPGYSTEDLYTIALNECEEVIESGNAVLESTFEGYWMKYHQENIAAGGESLWEIPFSESRGRMLFTFAVRHNSHNQHQENNGSPGTARGGQAGPLPNLYYDFDSEDTRRDVTCVPYRYATAVSNFARQELVDLNTWYFGKYRYEWLSGHRKVIAPNDDGMNKIYMRYAEVLLMAAEAANELGDPASAKNYLKDVRRRAFPASAHATKVDAYIDGLAGTEAIFNAIVDEHKFEFTGEFERKQALIRWNLLGTKLTEAKNKMTDLAAREGDYATVPTSLYFQYEADNETLDIYGLERGETTVQPGWTVKTWDNLNDIKINSLYTNNPDTKQFWPVWQVFIDASNGKLINDYGY